LKFFSIIVNSLIGKPNDLFFRPCCPSHFCIFALLHVCFLKFHPLAVWLFTLGLLIFFWPHVLYVLVSLLSFFNLFPSVDQRLIPSWPSLHWSLPYLKHVPCFGYQWLDCCLPV
jgi:hypothetical protein